MCRAAVPGAGVQLLTHAAPGAQCPVQAPPGPDRRGGAGRGRAGRAPREACLCVAERGLLVSLGGGFAEGGVTC